MNGAVNENADIVREECFPNALTPSCRNYPTCCTNTLGLKLHYHYRLRPPRVSTRVSDETKKKKNEEKTPRK